MHCPNCGAKASARQKFCRACGLSLERFAQLLAEPSPDVEGKDEDVERARRRLRYLESGAKLSGCVVGLAVWLLMASVIAEQHRLPQAQETVKMLSELNVEMSASVTEQTTARLEEKIES